jgi:hypothetical protein
VANLELALITQAREFHGSRVSAGDCRSEADIGIVVSAPTRSRCHYLEALTRYSERVKDERRVQTP